MVLRNAADLGRARSQVRASLLCALFANLLPDERCKSCRIPDLRSGSCPTWCEAPRWAILRYTAHLCSLNLLHSLHRCIHSRSSLSSWTTSRPTAAVWSDQLLKFAVCCAFFVCSRLQGPDSASGGAVYPLRWHPRGGQF